MSYTDDFDPMDENDFVVPNFGDNYSIADSVSTLNSKVKKQLKQLELLKMQDKDYRKVERFLNGKKKTIDLYATNSNPGSIIRDATLGSRISKMRVGSKDEDLFFKVTVSIEKSFPNRDSNIFFFDSPGQYERTTGSIVSPEVKSDWELKYSKEWAKRQ